MKVRELIDRLSWCDPDRDVYFEGPHEDDESHLVDTVNPDATAVWPRVTEDGVSEKWYRHEDEQETAENVVVIYG